MAGIKGRIKRAVDEASGAGVIIRQAPPDGTPRVFSDLKCWEEMFLTKVSLYSGEARNSEVLDAVRAATPESRAAFEAQYGSIEMEVRIVAGDYQGGWVEVNTLFEDGTVESVRHEGDTEEAKTLRKEATQGGTSF